jgi:hypothetical protein
MFKFITLNNVLKINFSNELIKIDIYFTYKKNNKGIIFNINSEIYYSFENNLSICIKDGLYKNKFSIDYTNDNIKVNVNMLYKNYDDESMFKSFDSHNDTLYNFDETLLLEFIDNIKNNNCSFIYFDYTRGAIFTFDENILNINIDGETNNCVSINLSDNALKNNFIEVLNKMYLKIEKLIK